MKTIIYVGHATGNFDFRSHLYAPIKKMPSYSRFNFVLPHDKDSLPMNSKSIIQSCTYMIADVSFPSTGLGIELGWAESFGKKVIALHQEDAIVSSSIRIINPIFVSYKNADDLTDKLELALKNIFTLLVGEVN